MDNGLLTKSDLELCSITVYRRALEHPGMRALSELLRAGSRPGFNIHRALRGYTALYEALLDAGYDSLGGYVGSIVTHDENAFTKAAAENRVTEGLETAARHDIAILGRIARLGGETIKQALVSRSEPDSASVIRTLPAWPSGVAPEYDALLTFHRENGCGDLARYHAFRWDGGELYPVIKPEEIRFEDMTGYSWQRQEVLENTRALVTGHKVNHVLLYGDSGTGKSATVKSLLNVPGFGRLRIIEVEKGAISRLPELFGYLRGKNHAFILFIDDLSFSEDDGGYRAMKVILEGSLDPLPDNTALYVTSNRRQLVQRRFSDQELDRGETVQEKTSLADRFGIRIPYLALSRKDYLETVSSLCRRAGAEFDRDELEKKALQWEMEHGSRTPRVASQFVRHFLVGGIALEP